MDGRTSMVIFSDFTIQLYNSNKLPLFFPKIF
jgi:hypothetical protein